MHRILIVEDDRDIAQLMEAALTQAGYQVELAFDGEVGADLIEQNWYALALLDIMLPKIDGYELFAYLREYGIPAIFITAKGEIADKTRGFHMGADDYLVKPFELEELVLRVENVLRAPRHGGEAAGEGCGGGSPHPHCPEERRRSIVDPQGVQSAPPAAAEQECGAAPVCPV